MIDTSIAGIKKTGLTINTSANTSVVLGGLDDLKDLEEVEAWIKQQLAASAVPAPIDVYIKGDEFSGIAFAKFASSESSAAAISAFRRKRVTCKGKFAWAKFDEPIHVRAPSSFLFGLKKMLVGWDFPQSSLHVNEQKGLMEYLGEEILSVESKNLIWNGRKTTGKSGTTFRTMKSSRG